MNANGSQCINAINSNQINANDIKGIIADDSKCIRANESNYINAFDAKCIIPSNKLPPDSIWILLGI